MAHDPKAEVRRTKDGHAWRIGRNTEIAWLQGEHGHGARDHICDPSDIRGLCHPASGVGVEGMKTPGANVFEIRNGKVMRLALYWAREDAFADLGLKE
jgi:hypothetical protein